MKESCRDIASRFGGTKLLSAMFGRHFPGCACERHRIGDNSPGEVTPEELLIRILFFPTHFDPVTGELLNSVFADAFHRGLSVYRVAHTDPGRIDEIAQAAIRQSEGRKIGYRAAVADCGEIKDIEDSGTRLFCVFDTSRPEDCSHADVCCPLCGTSAEPSKSARTRLYSDLRAAFRIRDLEEIW